MNNKDNNALENHIFTLWPCQNKILNYNNAIKLYCKQCCHLNNIISIVKNIVYKIVGIVNHIINHLNNILYNVVVKIVIV